MDYAQAKFWMDALVLVGVVLNTLYTWLANRNRATRSAINRVGGKIDGLDRRMTTVEGDMRHQPSHNDLKGIYNRLDEMSKAQSRAAGELQAVAHQLNLINQHLLKVE